MVASLNSALHAENQDTIELVVHAQLISPSLASSTVSDGYQVKLWAKYLRTHFVTTEGLHLRQSLGKWTSDSNLERLLANLCFCATMASDRLPKLACLFRFLNKERGLVTP